MDDRVHFFNAFSIFSMYDTGFGSMARNIVTFESEITVTNTFVGALLVRLVDGWRIPRCGGHPSWRLFLLRQMLISVQSATS
jgi:hypothetical protein